MTLFAVTIEDMNEFGLSGRGEEMDYSEASKQAIKAANEEARRRHNPALTPLEAEMLSMLKLLLGVAHPEFKIGIESCRKLIAKAEGRQ